MTITTLTDAQEKTIMGIVEIFETGKLNSNASAYSTVAVLKGDTGHISYGKHQASLGSGNLYLLIAAYASMPNAKYASSFGPYQTRLENRDTSLDYDTKFIQLLKDAGQDPVMQKTQDDYFERVFLYPAVKVGQGSNFRLPLSYAVIYDSFIHGSWARIRDRVTTPATDERGWITEYVADRRQWLGSHSNTLLRKTVYRMDTFNELIKAGNWNLTLPLKVRGVTISKEFAGVNEVVTEEDIKVIVDNNIKTGEDYPLIKYVTPIKKIAEVEIIQKKLNEKLKSNLLVDGYYGKKTAEKVAVLQKNYGLKVDSIVGPATWQIILA